MIKLLQEPQPNAYKARNKGIRQSCGAIIAITDADCILDENWLELIQVNFSNNNCDVISGRVRQEDCFLGKLTALVNLGDFQGIKSCGSKNFICGNFAIKSEIIKKIISLRLAWGQTDCSHGNFIKTVTRYSINRI